MSLDVWATKIVTVSLSAVLCYYSLKWLMEVVDPTTKNRKAVQKEARKILEKIGVNKDIKLDEHELQIASNLVDPLSMVTTWSDIGGLQNTIQEMKEAVILPFTRHDLFVQSQLLRPPKGILLHGPPGCGKTMIAKATAKEAGCRFINLQMTSLFDKWYGESQKFTAAVFSLALKIQPCIIFIDEIDTFLRTRNANDHECTAVIKAQFMSLWDGLTTDSLCQVMVMGATNRPQDIDKAILRRMPITFYVGLPGLQQREEIFKIILSQENIGEDVDFTVLAEKTEGRSGSDIKEICRSAAVKCVRDYIKENEESIKFERVFSCGGLRQIAMGDLVSSIEDIKESATKATSSLVFFSGAVD